MTRSPRWAATALAAACTASLVAAAPGGALVVAGSAAFAQRSQVPVYGARVEVVRLHAAVLDDDGPVTDLGAGDFVVVDNGVEHEVALALSPVETPIDVVLAFDQSDSIRQAAPTVKRDARAFLDALGVDDCAFVLPFQHRVGPGVWGPSVAPTLLEIIDLTPLEGGTSLHDAVVVGLSEVQGWHVPGVLAERVVTEYVPPTIEGGVGIDFGPGSPSAAEPVPSSAPGRFELADLPFRVFDSAFGCGATGMTDPDRRRALVVLSDGVDTTSVHTFGELLGFVYRTDVPVFPVLIGHPGSGAPNVNRDMQRVARRAEQRMAMLAEVSGGRVVRGSGAESRLRAAYEEIITILRGSYLLGYYPSRTGPSAAEVHEHRVEVKVRRGDVEVFARTEYHRADGAAAAARAAVRVGAELLYDDGPRGALLQGRAAVAAAPDLAEGYLLQAAALWADDRLDAALPPLQRALELAPGVAAAHYLAWQVHFDRGDSDEAWRQAILAQLAGADMEKPMQLLTERAGAPEQLEALLMVPRVFVEGPRGADADAYQRLRSLVHSLERAVSGSPLFGLVRDPVAADYYLYLDAGDPDRRRPDALESRLELYNYTDQRLWREDLDVADLADEEQVAAAVRRAMAKLEDWLLEGR